MTDNHSYDTPPAGTLDWHKPLNRNFERIDTDVEVRDTDANRGNYTPKVGAKFLATDTGDVYLGDGSAWSQIGSIAGSSSSGSSDGGIFAELEAGNVVALASELSSPQVIDPNSTGTPVQDALDVLDANGGGEVRLPPGPVTEAGPIKPYSRTSIEGFGPDVSSIVFSNQPTDGIVFDQGGGAVSRVYLSGFALTGPGPGQGDTGVAIHHVNGDTQDLFVGRMLFWGWNNSIYKVDRGVGPFQCRHELLTVYGSDAGDQGAMFDFDSYYGPANWFGTIAVYPSAKASGKNTTVFRSRGGTQNVNHLTMGGSAGVALHQTYDGVVNFGNIHWEPTTNPTDPGTIVRLDGRGGAHIGTLVHVTGTADYAFELGYDSYNGFPPSRKVIGTYHELGQTASLNNNIVNLTHPGDASRPSLYYGVAGDVDVTHTDSATGGLRALGDAGTAL